MFSIEYNGITISNGITEGLNITEAEGLYGLPIRGSELERVDADGGNIYVQRYSMRSIILQIEIITTNADDYFAKVQEIVSAFAKTNETKKLVVRRWDTVSTSYSIEARVVESPMILEKGGQNNIATARVKLRCPDPFWSDEVSQSYSTGIGSKGGFPVGGPISRPISRGANNTITIDNIGDTSTFAFMEIDGDVTNPVITNVTTGQSFVLNTSISAGETVTLSKGQEGFRVLKNSDNYMQYFSGTFFKLQQGMNVIVFQATSSDDNALLTVTYGNKYISL